MSRIPNPRRENRGQTLNERKPAAQDESYSLIPGVPMLTLNPMTNNSNLAVVRSKLHIHVARNYETLGDCIKLNALEVLKGLDETQYDLSRENDRFLLARRRQNHHAKR